jgi:acetyl-CoA carboxylase carboxyl transferase subunit alpha
MPLITFVDTPGAWTALPDEERGQAWALAENIGALADLRTPIVSVVIGEGGSGGALALGVADRLLMLEHAVYSVAPSEQVANILWKDAKLAPLAAEAVKLTAQDLLDLGVIDRIVPEPPGGAHSDQVASADAVRAALEDELDSLDGRDVDELLSERYGKYRRMGALQSA